MWYEVGEQSFNGLDGLQNFAWRTGSVEDTRTEHGLQGRIKVLVLYSSQ